MSKRFFLVKVAGKILILSSGGKRGGKSFSFRAPGASRRRRAKSTRRKRRGKPSGGGTDEEPERLVRRNRNGPGEKNRRDSWVRMGRHLIGEILKKDIPFEVILVSPRNYFLYTPLLPGVATGAIETRSIVESIRRPIAEKGFKYYEAGRNGYRREE